MEVINILILQTFETKNKLHMKPRTSLPQECFLTCWCQLPNRKDDWKAAGNNVLYCLWLTKWSCGIGHAWHFSKFCSLWVALIDYSLSVLLQILERDQNKFTVSLSLNKNIVGFFLIFSIYILTLFVETKHMEKILMRKGTSWTSILALKPQNWLGKKPDNREKQTCYI